MKRLLLILAYFALLWWIGSAPSSPDEDLSYFGP